MVKNKFFLLLFLFPLLASAQPDSSFLILRFNGGYADIGSSNGAASLGAVESSIRDWNIGLTVGFPVSDHWEAGIGFEYRKQKATTGSEIYLPQQWVAMQLTETDINLVIGKAYLAGSWRLFSRLYFNPVLSVGIGQATGVQKYLTAARAYISPSEIISIGESVYTGNIGGESDISYSYFAIGLAPAFSFYFTRHFALNLETGNFRFSTTDWKWDNKQWLANINPEYWRLGIVVAF